MALNMCETRFNGIKIAFFSKKLQKIAQRSPQTPQSLMPLRDPPPDPPSVIHLSYTGFLKASPKLRICTFQLYKFKPSPFAKSWLSANRQVFDDVIPCGLWFRPHPIKNSGYANELEIAWKKFWRPFFWRTLAAVFLVLGLGLEYSCPWPREDLSSERLSLALASDFFVSLALALALASSLVSSTSPLVITLLINKSFKNAGVPKLLKTAFIKPLLKNYNLKLNEPKHYRPVFNLPNLSKLLEKVVARQLDEHLEGNNLQSPMQSAYKRHHSAETALLLVHNDIVKSLDDDKFTVLLQLDLSAAFDTVDHDILLQRLQNPFGICDKTLQWFASYLSKRYRRVVIGESVSQPKLLSSGIPQGSILWPKLFLLYLNSVGDIFNKNGLSYQIYADDILIYFTANFNSTGNISSKISYCLKTVLSYMNLSKLKLNYSKTKLIVFTPPRKCSPLQYVVTADTNNLALKLPVPVSESVKNLGVILVQHMTLEKQKSSTLKSCFFHLKNISYLTSYLNFDSIRM